MELKKTHGVGGLVLPGIEPFYKSGAIKTIIFAQEYW